MSGSALSDEKPARPPPAEGAKNDRPESAGRVACVAAQPTGGRTRGRRRTQAARPREGGREKTSAMRLRREGSRQSPRMRGARRGSSQDGHTESALFLFWKVCGASSAVNAT